MRAWVVRRIGGLDAMDLEDIERQPDQPGMVRIAVKAAAVNFFDTLQLAGTYQVRPDLPFIPGAEVAGLVVSAPADSGFRPGDRVLAVVGQSGLVQGGYTELTNAEPRRTVRIPDAMPFDEAAAFFVNYQTGWFGLHRRASLRPGELVLVHAGAGGVGSAAIQIAKAAGARVVATAGTTEKVALCRKLGAELAIDYSQSDFAKEVNDFTDGRGADVIYDPVGGDVFERSTKCVAFEGRIVVVGFTSGRVPEVRANHALVKNYSVVGLHWGLYAERSPHLIPECTAELLELYSDGKIRPLVSRRFPLEEAREALATVASRRSTGKVVLVNEAGSQPSPPQ